MEHLQLWFLRAPSWAAHSTKEVVGNCIVPAAAAVVARVPTHAISYEYLQDYCERGEGWGKIIRPDAHCQECGSEFGEKVKFRDVA